MGHPLRRLIRRCLERHHAGGRSGFLELFFLIYKCLEVIRELAKDFGKFPQHRQLLRLDLF
jgi:hypothetical protein